MAEQTRSKITVSASRSDIMAVIADFESYPAWANVKRTEVLKDGAGGRASRVRCTLDAGVIKDTYTLGVQLPMIGMLKRRAEEVIVETALKGLKKRVES